MNTWDKMIQLNKLVKLFVNLGLLFFVFFFTIILFEISLRFLCPQYKYSAEANLCASPSRIWINKPNSRHYMKHPDLNKENLVIFNSLGFRQHREFLRNKPKDTVRIAFFGDSFTANERIESQYSFTEPLDYLLNKT